MWVLADRRMEEGPCRLLQGYLTHKKLRIPLGLPYVPRQSPTVGSWEGALSYERGTPERGQHYRRAGVQEVNRCNVGKLIDSALGGAPREQKMLKGNLPRVINHPVY